MLRNEAGVHAGVDEVRLAQQCAQEADVGGHAGHGELVERALRTGYRLLEGGTTAGHLHQQRVEVRGNLRTDGRCTVETHARTARRTVLGQRTGIRTETVGRILSSDTALQGRAGDVDVLLLEAQLLEGESRGNLHLGLHDVHARDLLGHGVLDLHARVHLDEDVVTLLIHEELNRAGALVIDVLAELHGVRTDAVTQLRVQRRGRGDLHDLLVAALHGAVTLIQVHNVALRVRQNLHLNVLRANHRSLKVDVAVTEGGLRLAGCLCAFGLDFRLVLDETHAAAATAGNCLYEDGELKVLGVFRQLVDVRRGLRVLQSRQTRLLGRGDCGSLVAGQVQGLGGGADELNAVFAAGAGQIRTLREEAIAWVNGIRTGLLDGANNLIDIEIGLDRLALGTNAHCLISERAVEGVAVFLGVNGDRLGTNLEGRAESTHGNFAAVCHQDLGEGFVGGIRHWE